MGSKCALCLDCGDGFTGINMSDVSCGIVLICVVCSCQLFPLRPFLKSTV